MSRTREEVKRQEVTMADVNMNMNKDRSSGGWERCISGVFISDNQ